MKYHLLNSAVITKEGIYTAERISLPEFLTLVDTAYEKGKLYNYIGYETNIKLLNSMLDIRLSINRDEIINLEDGDILLVMKLKRRLQNVSFKSDAKFQSNISINDFEFFKIVYHR
ncbi:MAG: YddF family protein [Candidatus Omnitrophica bacterium]|nr:YddF family protein [Candidatus Omnitrophota bacterium]